MNSKIEKKQNQKKEEQISFNNLKKKTNKFQIYRIIRINNNWNKKMTIIIIIKMKNNYIIINNSNKFYQSKSKKLKNI